MQEWEEKLNQAQEEADTYKKKYLGVKDSGSMMHEARMVSQRLAANMGAQSGHHDESVSFQSGGTGDISGGYPRSRGVESVASLGSGLAQQARTLVGSFACAGQNERSNGVLATELSEGRQDHDFLRNVKGPARAVAVNSNGKPQSFRKFDQQGPRRVDV